MIKKQRGAAGVERGGAGKACGWEGNPMGKGIGVGKG